MSLKALYVGTFGKISTCRLRAEAMQALGVAVERLEGQGPSPWRHLGARVFNRLFGHPWQRKAVARSLVDRVAASRPDVVWFDKAIFVPREALERLRQSGQPLLIHYNPDDPFGHSPGVWSTFVRAIPAYDVHFVPRSENVAEYRHRGARVVIPFDRGFSLTEHRPPSPCDPRLAEFAVPVAFTGTYERERASSISKLIANGVDVAIRGGLWDRSPQWPTLQRFFRGREVAGEEYALALGAPQITLHFLRHSNRDEQDSRTFEIPACGGFMMAEWSRRHAELFEEDREAVFFRNDDELVEKVKYYLSRPEECSAIAARGRARALASGYDYESRMHELLSKAMKAASRLDLLDKLPAREGVGA